MKYRTLTILVLAFALLGSFASLQAQTDEIPRYTVEQTWDSGSFDAAVGFLKADAELVYTDIVSVPNVPWMQLNFDSAELGENSRIEITSVLDGATQTLDARAFKAWNNHSAYFNGDAVEIRLYAGGEDRQVNVKVGSIVVGEWAAPTKSICGVDNRTASNEQRVARIDPIGCTGWIISNGKYLTAGHCLDGSGNTTLSFNVPASLSNGTVQFPGPEDQYPIVQGSFNYADGGVGNDWGVFEVGANTQTGLTAFQAQGSFNFRQDLSPSTIRITGFGVDSGSTNQTNQTHVGSNTGSSGTTLRYNADTMGGNSGSPVIDESTGEAIGIHTHGGCSSSGGNNNGTSFFNSNLWAAVNAGGGGGGGGGPTELTKGVAETGLSGSTGNEQFFTLDVPSGATNLSFDISGGSGDADLYVRFGSAPTTSTYDCRPYLNGNNESCDFASPSAGTYHVMVRAYSTYSGLSLVGDYTAGGGGGGGGSCSYDNDFESGDTAGWANDASSTCSTGAYTLGNPTQQTSTITTQPAGSASGSNSIFTATNSSAGNADVDGGNCILTKSAISVPSSSTLSFNYFHGQRDSGDDASGDFFNVQYRVNGGSWVTVVSRGDSRTTASWTAASATVPAGNVELRMQCSDGSGPGDIVECGIDDVKICD